MAHRDYADLGRREHSRRPRAGGLTVPSTWARIRRARRWMLSSSMLTRKRVIRMEPMRSAAAGPRQELESSCAPMGGARLAAARFAAARARFARELAAAADAHRDPDVAAIALDGLLLRMLSAWYAACGWPPCAAGDLLLDLERRAPELAWRLRLALRAPDVVARLAHARQVLAALSAALGAAPEAAPDEPPDEPPLAAPADEPQVGPSYQFHAMRPDARPEIGASDRAQKEAIHDVR